MGTWTWRVVAPLAPRGAFAVGGGPLNIPPLCGFARVFPELLFPVETYIFCAEWGCMTLALSDCVGTVV